MAIKAHLLHFWYKLLYFAEVIIYAKWNRLRYALLSLWAWATCGPRLPKWLQKFVRISSRKHDEMSSFCLNNGFRLQKTNRAARRWKQPPKKPFHHVSRDKILHDSWIISAALARGFSHRILNEEKALGTTLHPIQHRSSLRHPRRPRDR